MIARLRPPQLLVAVLVMALLASGCAGTVVDPVKLEDTIQADLERSLRVKIQAVECPSDVSVDPGATFTCEVISSDGERKTATLKIRNKDADITMIGLKNKN